MLSDLEPQRVGASRREWMLRALETAAALGMLVPAVGGQAHANGDAQTKAPAWKPQFLTAQQNETLVALGERIVPGSAEAQCNRLIDAVLAIESEENRNAMTAALAAFDAEAETVYRRAFRNLSAAEQDHILGAPADESGRLHSEFSIVKEWVSDAYWSSENGLRELGWTGRLTWDSFPGCGSGHPHN